jgi:acyl-CoA thioester hydrolase
VDVELEVPFHDVDSLNIVWHGHYYKYAEIGRTALMRARGLDMHQLKTASRSTLVVDTHCRYMSPLRYGDRFRVRSWVASVDHKIVVGFEIYNLTHQRRSAHGHAVLATIDGEGRLLSETPRELADALKP